MGQVGAYVYPYFQNRKPTVAEFNAAKAGLRAGAWSAQLGARRLNGHPLVSVTPIWLWLPMIPRPTPSETYAAWVTRSMAAAKAYSDAQAAAYNRTSNLMIAAFVVAATAGAAHMGAFSSIGGTGGGLTAGGNTGVSTALTGGGASTGITTGSLSATGGGVVTGGGVTGFQTTTLASLTTKAAAPSLLQTALATGSSPTAAASIVSAGAPSSLLQSALTVGNYIAPALKTVATVATTGAALNAAFQGAKPKTSMVVPSQALIQQQQQQQAQQKSNNTMMMVGMLGLAVAAAKFL